MSWRKFLLACALLAPLAAFAEPDAAKAKDGGKKADTASKSSADAALDGLPAGQTFHGVHIPNFSPSGKLLMMFDAQSAKRIDDRDIEMEGLKIEIHNDDGTTFHVEMSHSVFNLDTRILTSDTPTTIKRDDFIINGDKAQFHVKERFGRVTGNVKMTINSGNTDSDSEQPAHPKKPGNKTK